MKTYREIDFLRPRDVFTKLYGNYRNTKDWVEKDILKNIDRYYKDLKGFCDAVKNNSLSRKKLTDELAIFDCRKNKNKLRAG